MMKRILYVILSLGALGAVAWLSVDISQAVHARKALERRIEVLPPLELIGLEGEFVNIAAGSPRGTVLLYFTTTCPFCADEIEDFIANAALFEHAAVVLVSAEDPEILRSYTKRTDLELRTDFVVASDDAHAAARYFGIRSVPAAFVYDGSGRLLRRFDGFTSAATVASALSQIKDEPGIAGTAEVAQ